MLHPLDYKMAEKEQAANQTVANSQTATDDQQLTQREKDAIEIAQQGDSSNVVGAGKRIAARREAARKSFFTGDGGTGGGGGSSGGWDDNKEATAPTKKEETPENPAQVENPKTNDEKPTEEKAAEKKDTENKDPIDASRPNPLQNYADYTYGLSLHVIPVEKYNQLVNDSEFQYKNDDETVLIASAGRRSDVEFQRNPEFQEDFYFENLKFLTVVGLNSRSRNTNAIEISFTLVEPYGFTLLNRFLRVTKDIAAESWMQIPFMLQIDFFGNNELGELLNPIPNQTKYIPIRIIEIKSKVTPKGAEYQVAAIPYNHQAYSDVAGNTPVFLEVNAGTIAEFFSAQGSLGDIEKFSAIKKASKERVDTLGKEINDLRKSKSNNKRLAEAEKELKEFASNVSTISYFVGSYAAALNDFQQQLQKDNDIQYADSYEFVFDEVFKDSKITVPQKTEAARTKMLSPSALAIRAKVGLPSGIDLSKNTFSINPQTNIIEVINLVMRQSDYVRSQFKDPATELDANGNPTKVKPNIPINWYKIIPKIEIKNFDLRRNIYSKKITFYVFPYKYHNTKFRDGPQSQPKVYVKKYDYIYTGKNESILNFDIDFNTMFYTYVTAGRSKVQTTAVQELPKQDSQNDTSVTKEGPKVQDRVTHPVSGTQELVSPTNPDNLGILVNDFTKSTMSNSRGDMINVNLKIIGDPEFIKQDDLYFNPANNPDQKTKEIIDPRTNSLIFDAGEIFALLEFKTPLDVDQSTGMMSFDKVENSVFSGLYKVITVENLFEKGQFTQTLNLVRHFEQPKYDTPSGNKDDNKKSQENRQEAPKTVKETKEQTKFIDNPGGAAVAILKPRRRSTETSSTRETSKPTSAKSANESSAEIAKQQEEIRGALPQE